MKTERRWVVIILGVTLAASGVAGYLTPEMLRAGAISRESFLQVFEPLFLASLLIERVIEVFISIWRDSGATELVIKAKEAGVGAAKAEADLAAYRDSTRTWTLLVGVAVGVIVCSLGLRSLGHLLDVESLRSTLQRQALTFLDVLFTGTLVGGGSDFLHKVISVFTNFLDTTAQKARPHAPLPAVGG
jgi:hypothetical protein